MKCSNRFAVRFFAAAFTLIFLSGCTMLGASVATLRNQDVKYSKVIEKDVSVCYEKTLEALEKWNASVYDKRDNEYIIAMKCGDMFKACIDTTELAIFFEEAGPGKTEVTVTSLNYNLSQAVSEKLFQYLEKETAKN